MKPSGMPLSAQERMQFASEGARSLGLELARRRACPSGHDYTRSSPTERIAARKLDARRLGEVDGTGESG